MYLLNPEFQREPLLLLPPRACISVHPECFRNISSATIADDQTGETDEQDWKIIVNHICYVMLPMVLFCSIVGLVVNIVIFFRQIRMSLDTFLLGYTFSSLSYILAVIVLVLPHYIGPSLILTQIRFYNMMFTQWTSFTCVWILISAGIERALTSAMPHKDHSGTSRQAWIIVSIVTFISLISALPVLWEYRVVMSDLSPYQSAQTNASNYLIKRPSTAEKSEFHVVYFCYISSLFVYLPYFLAIVTCISLGTNSRRLRLNLRPIYRTTRGVILNRKISEEIAASKLLIIVLIAYVISSAPLTVVNFLANPIIGKVDLNDDVIILVCNVLAVWYHIYYVIQQQLYFCYNKQYRLTMLTWCC